MANRGKKRIKPKSPKQAAQAARMQERRELVAQYRRAGRTTRQIVELLKEEGHRVTQPTVVSDLEAIYSELRERTLHEAKVGLDTDLARVEEAIAVLYPMVLGGDLQALDRFDRMLERRAKLLGYQHLKIELSTPEGRPLEVAQKRLPDDPAYYQQIAAALVEAGIAIERAGGGEDGPRAE